MSRIEREVLEGCRDELEKISLSLSELVKNPTARRVLGSAGAFGGHGAAIGAGIGALHGAYKNYREAKDQGVDTAHALGVGALGGLGGAASGMTIGGLGGAAVGGLAGHLAPNAIEGVTKKLTTDKNWTGALGRFGQRQVHGFTGWTPEGGIESIRGGAWQAKKNLTDLMSNPKASKEDIHRAYEGWLAMKKVQDRGLTNIPGVVKALAGKDRLKALKELAGAQLQGQTGSMKLLTMGMAGLPIIEAARAKDVEGGPGKGEQIGAGIGGVVGGLTSAALPFTAGGPVMEATSGVGRRVGKAVDWLRGRRNNTQYANNPEDPSMAGQNTPSERHMSPSAMGQAPEGMMV